MCCIWCYAAACAAPFSTSKCAAAAHAPHRTSGSRSSSSTTSSRTTNTSTTATPTCSPAPVGGRAPGGATTPPETPPEFIELGLEDEWLEAVTYIEVGPEGERVDKKEYVTHWEETIRSQTADDPLLRKVRDEEPLEPHEEEELARHLNRPERYFNEDNLRRAYRDPGGSLVDFIRAALGRLHIKSREEKLEETFRAWLVARSLTPQQAEYLCLLKNRGIATGQVSLNDLFEPPLSILDPAGKGVELFGEEGLKEVVARLNVDVFKAAG